MLSLGGLASAAQAQSFLFNLHGHTVATDIKSSMANTTLSFTLSPEGIVRLHDIVLCLGKFSESVSIEARRDRVCDQQPQEQPLLMSITAQSDRSQLLKVCLCIIFVGQSSFLF